MAGGGDATVAYWKQSLVWHGPCKTLCNYIHYPKHQKATYIHICLLSRISYFFPNNRDGHIAMTSKVAEENSAFYLCKPLQPVGCGGQILTGYNQNRIKSN